MYSLRPYEPSGALCAMFKSKSGVCLPYWTKKANKKDRQVSILQCCKSRNGKILHLYMKLSKKVGAGDFSHEPFPLPPFGMPSSDPRSVPFLGFYPRWHNYRSQLVDSSGQPGRHMVSIGGLPSTLTSRVFV